MCSYQREILLNNSDVSVSRMVMVDIPSEHDMGKSSTRSICGLGDRTVHPSVKVSLAEPNREKKHGVIHKE